MAAGLAPLLAPQQSWSSPSRARRVARRTARRRQPERPNPGCRAGVVGYAIGASGEGERDGGGPRAGSGRRLHNGAVVDEPIPVVCLPKGVASGLLLQGPAITSKSWRRLSSPLAGARGRLRSNSGSAGRFSPAGARRPAIIRAANPRNLGFDFWRAFKWTVVRGLLVVENRGWCESRD